MLFVIPSVLRTESWAETVPNMLCLMIPVSDLMIRVISKKKVSTYCPPECRFRTPCDSRSRPVYHRPALCDHCELLELNSVLMLITENLSVASESVRVLGFKVVRLRLPVRHLIELSTHNFHVSVG